MQSTSSQSRLLIGLEQSWLHVGVISHLLNDPDRSRNAYEAALRLNPASISAHLQLGHLYHNQRQYLLAIDCYQRALSLNSEVTIRSDVWGAMAHCWVMVGDTNKALAMYQQALQYASQDANLWFGIGLVYDRIGSNEQALEAFVNALRMELNRIGVRPKRCIIPTARLCEIYYRLGLIMRSMRRFDAALQCLLYVREFPPVPLTREDIIIQIAATFELQDSNTDEARRLYSQVLDNVEKQSEETRHRARLHLGWLLVKNEVNIKHGLEQLEALVHEQPSEALGWYYCGRIYMKKQNYNAAYDAYQKAVFQDGANAALWNSIGILYQEIKQYRDALDAFTRAIHQAPLIPQIWWNLGTLYESCNGQLSDALDAYQRAAELDPSNKAIAERISVIKSSIESRLDIPDRVEIDPVAYHTRMPLLGSISIPPQKTPISKSAAVSAPVASSNASTLGRAARNIPNRLDFSSIKRIRQK